MHLVRLMRMGLEVLQTGDLRVRRDDADELASIRDGAVPFAELLTLADTLHAGIDTAAQATSLPSDVDPVRVDALVQSLLTQIAG
jgi:hypothetical protein